MRNDESDLIYEQIANELDSGNRVRGLWVRCFAEAGGDENKAKARYINERFQQIERERESTSAAEAQKILELSASELRKKFMEGRSLSPCELTGLVELAAHNKMLLGARDNARGNTILHLLAIAGLKEDYLKMVEAGADEALTNGSGRTPRDIALSTWGSAPAELNDSVLCKGALKSAESERPKAEARPESQDSSKYSSSNRPDYMQGGMSLVRSFWLVYIPITIAIGLVIKIVDDSQALGFVYLVSFIAFIGAALGLWRSAIAYKGFALWKYLAMAHVVTSYIGWILGFVLVSEL